MKTIKLSQNVSVVAPQMLKKNSTTHSMYLVPVNYDEIRNNIQEFGLLNPQFVMASEVRLSEYDLNNVA